MKEQAIHPQSGLDTKGENKGTAPSVSWVKPQNQKLETAQLITSLEPQHSCVQSGNRDSVVPASQVGAVAMVSSMYHLTLCVQYAKALQTISECEALEMCANTHSAHITSI